MCPKMELSVLSVHIAPGKIRITFEVEEGIANVMVRWRVN